MKPKLSLILRILASIILAMLSAGMLWIAYLAVYYLHYAGWLFAILVALLPALIAILCGLGIWRLWLQDEAEDYCEWEHDKRQYDSDQFCIGHKTSCNRYVDAEETAFLKEQYIYCPYCGKRIKVLD